VSSSKLVPAFFCAIDLLHKSQNHPTLAAKFPSYLCPSASI
jgi:hypothetical protein